MGYKFKTDFLVASPSYASGASRLMDWYGTFDAYNVSQNGIEADAKAIGSDWRMVGEDIENAIEEFELLRTA